MLMILDINSATFEPLTVPSLDQIEITFVLKYHYQLPSTIAYGETGTFVGYTVSTFQDGKLSSTHRLCVYTSGIFTTFLGKVYQTFFVVGIHGVEYLIRFSVELSVRGTALGVGPFVEIQEVQLSQIFADEDNRPL